VSGLALLPRSIAGRTTLLLIVGMLLVTAAGIAVSAITLLGGEPTVSLVDRVATLAAVAEGLPPRDRPVAFAGAEQVGLRVRDLGDVTPTAAPPVFADWFTDRMWAELQRELTPLGVRVVALGHTMGGDTGGAAHLWAPHGPVLARIELPDGARFDVETRDGWSPLAALGRMIPGLLVVGLGLAGLAALAARRVTRPLGGFAAAAVRLGADPLAAKPSGLDETRGPSEIRAAARAFEGMRARIRRLLEDRMQMLAAVSHDLRTPITRLRLRAEFVEDEAERAKMLKDLEEMEAMIHAAIAFVREETAEVQPRAPLDLACLLEEIRAELTDIGGAIRIAPGPERAPIEGRSLALKRALRNLVENAVKYGGSAEMRLERGATGYTVTIEDGGPGIPEAELETVFRPFHRLERSRSRETGGTGLGLAVARAVVRGHGGEIVLANRPEGGLRQTVLLPRA
jgi:signal transduction histidine kinase